MKTVGCIFGCVVGFIIGEALFGDAKKVSDCDVCQNKLTTTYKIIDANEPVDDARYIWHEQGDQRCQTAPPHSHYRQIGKYGRGYEWQVHGQARGQRSMEPIIVETCEKCPFVHNGEYLFCKIDRNIDIKGEFIQAEVNESCPLKKGPISVRLKSETA